MAEKKVKILVLAGMIVLGLVLIAGFWLRPKSKPETGRIVGTNAGWPLELLGAEKGVKRGEEREIELVLKTGDEAVSGINVVMEVDERYLAIKELVINEEVFGSVFKNDIEGNEARVFVTAVNMKTTGELPKGDLRVAKMKVVGKSKGGSYVVLLPETYATRVNMSDSGDNQMSLNLINGEIIVE